MTSPLLTPLAQATSATRYGAKAANLARLLNAGINTAPGIVLSVDALQEQLNRLELTGRVASLYSALNNTESDTDALRLEASKIRQVLLENRLPPDLMAVLNSEIGDSIAYAVRSSAPGEDGAESSFAGQFDSILDCRTPDAVAQGIATVWASLFSERAIAYSLHHHCRPQGMAVVIQQQVEAAISGVMFTRDPRHPAGNDLLVEYCAGLGEQLVSGQVSPGRLRLDRDDGTVVVEERPEQTVAGDPALPQARAPLLTAAIKLEALFGGPQDVEWSLDSSGQLYVLQSRPITAVSEPGPGIVWSNANIAENFPDPVCPMLRSFVARGYAAYFRGLGQAFGISTRRMEAMADALDNLVDCHGGRLYYNLSNIHTVLHLAPGGPWLSRFFNQFTGAREFPEPKRIKQNRAAQLVELMVVAWRVVWRYLHVQRGLKRFEQRVDDYAVASAPEKLVNKSPAQLASLLKGFLEIRLERWTDAALADTAAMVCYGMLQALLRGQAGLDANDLLKGLPGLASAVPVERLWDLSREIHQNAELDAAFSNDPAEVILKRLRDGEFPTFYAALNGYFDSWGFRSSGELMLSQPTPREDPLPVLRLLKSYAASKGEGPADVSRRQAESRRCATQEARQQLGPLRGLIFPLILRATQGAIRLRERARMKQALLYTRLRHVALALGKTLVAGDLLNQPDDVLFLTMEEAIALGEGEEFQAADIRRWIAERRGELTAWMELSPPDSFVLPEGKSWHPGLAEDRDTGAVSTEGLSGTGACGGLACGHAAVVLDVAEIDRIRQDQILVTRQTDPGWAAVFFMVKGLVIERGGLLSHGAIIAREYGIPAVVGVRDATRLIGDGQFLSVDGDRGRVDYVRD